jgi:hypothetical protein
MPGVASCVSAAAFGTENLLRSLSQVRLGFKRREERQIVPPPAVMPYPAADQLRSWLDLIPGKLIHQLTEFLAQRTYGRILRSADLGSTVCRRRRHGDGLASSPLGARTLPTWPANGPFRAAAEDPLCSAHKGRATATMIQPSGLRGLRQATTKPTAPNAAENQTPDRHRALVGVDALPGQDGQRRLRGRQHQDQAAEHHRRPR